MKKETIEMFHLVIATALQLKKAAGMLADGAVPEPATPKARPPCGQFGPPHPKTAQIGGLFLQRRKKNRG